METTDLLRQHRGKVSRGIEGRLGRPRIAGDDEQEHQAQHQQSLHRQHPLGCPILRAPVGGSRAGRPGDAPRHGGDDQTSPAIHGGFAQASSEPMDFRGII